MNTFKSALAATILTAMAFVPLSVHAEPTLVFRGSVSPYPQDKSTAKLRGTIIAVEKGIDSVRAQKIAAEGFGAFVAPRSAVRLRLCNDAVVVVMSEQESVFGSPSDSNYPFLPKIVSFSCAD